jgi:ATP-dependent exoDNAse (exonuclease V) beta subunit
VQAPAGSGKTELLIQRFLTLLARVEQPESVLAITFTVKAAEEMRARVIHALEAAAGNPPPEGVHDRISVDLATAVNQQDEAARWQLRLNPSRLRIQTIDALCASIVRRMPWMARFGAMPAVSESPAPAYREAARNTLRRLLSEEASAGDVRRLVLHLDGDWRRAQLMLEAILPKRDQWLRHIGTGANSDQARAALEATLGEVVRSHLVRLSHLTPPPAAQPWVTLVNFVQKGTIESLPPPEPEALGRWRQFADLVLTQSGEWRKSVDRRHGFPASAVHQKRMHGALMRTLEAVPELREALHELRQLPELRFSDPQWCLMRSLLVLLPAAAAELKIAFSKRGEVDFVEVAEAARIALGDTGFPTDLALALGERVEHILVDEMQDTSVTQVALVEKLIAGWDPGDGRTLFLVGDPMQSIYRFREADVGLFLRIRAGGLGGIEPEALTLSANFRSSPAVVDWVNRVFGRLFPAEDDATLGAVAYNTCTAHRPPSEDTGVWLHPSFGLDQEAEAQLVADLVEQRRGGTTAVLLRARPHGLAIVAELRRHRILYRAVDLDPLGDRPVISDLHALTRALLHPADRTAWLAVLRAPWCGFTRAELYAIAGGNPDALIWELLPEHSTPHLDRLRGVLAGALDRIRRQPLRQCVEQAWIDLGGPACYDVAAHADARRYLDLLEQLTEGGEVEDMRALEEALLTLFAQPDPAADGSVQVMTIHKAKGLEFDTVIVPGLGRGPAADASPLLRWTELPDMGSCSEQGLLFAPIEASAASPDPVYHYLGALERRRRRHEALRLFYVAATRAKQRLHLLGHLDMESKRPRPGSLLELAWPALEPDFQRAVQSAPRLVGPTLTESPRLRRLVPDWCPPEAPALVAGRRPAEVEESIPFDSAHDTLRHVGTLVHAWLERISREGLDCWTAERVRRTVPAIRAALESLPTVPAEVPGAIELVQEALIRTLADERGRWILAPRPMQASEFAVTAVVDGVARHYVIDRTFIEDGVRWLIDYKTACGEGSETSQFLDSEVLRYRARMERYRQLFEQMDPCPVRVALYFPLLSGWRTW